MTTPAAATPERVTMTSLLGEKLLVKAEGGAKHTKTLLKDKDLVALYFSASWCPPCKTFSPLLREFYNAAAKDNKLEIVYISSDKDLESFNEYYGKMPWLAIPCEEGSAAVKQSLAQTIGIQGIPTLAILDARTGEFITADARKQVEDASGDQFMAKRAINQWKGMPRKHISEAADSMPGVGGNPIMKIVMFFAKNPIYIFGLMYFYKYLTKQMKEWYPEAYGDAGIEDEVPEPDTTGDEF